MPRYNVVINQGEKNEKWAFFSSITEEFITNFSDKESYEQWRLSEYGENDYKPAEQCNMMSLSDAIYMLSLNHSDEDIINNLRDAELIASHIE